MPDKSRAHHNAPAESQKAHGGANPNRIGAPDPGAEKLAADAKKVYDKAAEDLEEFVKTQEHRREVAEKMQRQADKARNAKEE